MQAVRFDAYGDVDVLEVRDVEAPVPGRGEVLIRVRAAAINPGEIAIREGVFAERWPSAFPSGQGSDLAGEVEAIGDGVSAYAPGDKVLGWTDARASHAEYVVAPADQLTRKPATVDWDVAGSLFIAPCAAYASVQAVAPAAGDTVVVSGAAGGVGAVAVQLARHTGAIVIGLAGEGNQEWLRLRGIVPVLYGAGQEDRIREAAGGPVDAFIDTYGGGYVDLAVALGVAPDRINTLIDWDAAQRVGAHTRGCNDVGSPAVLAELARLVAERRLEIPIARTYPLRHVRDAYRELAERHTRGKLVLRP